LPLVIINICVNAAVVAHNDQFQDMDGAKLNVLLDVATAERLGTAVSASYSIELACLCVIFWMSSKLLHAL
jgi:hypothetical protein